MPALKAFSSPDFDARGSLAKLQGPNQLQLTANLQLLKGVLAAFEQLPFIGNFVRAARSLVAFVLDTVHVRNDLRKLTENVATKIHIIATAAQEVRNAPPSTDSVNRALNSVQNVLTAINEFVRREAQSNIAQYYWRKNKAKGMIKHLNEQLHITIQNYQLASSMRNNALMEKMHIDYIHSNIADQLLLQRAITWPKPDLDITLPKVQLDVVEQETISTKGTQKVIKHDISLLSRIVLTAVRYTCFTLVVYALLTFFGSSDVHARPGTRNALL